MTSQQIQRITLLHSNIFTKGQCWNYQVNLGISSVTSQRHSVPWKPQTKLHGASEESLLYIFILQLCADLLYLKESMPWSVYEFIIVFHEFREQTIFKHLIATINKENDLHTWQAAAKLAPSLNLADMLPGSVVGRLISSFIKCRHLEAASMTRFAVDSLIVRSSCGMPLQQNLKCINLS